jgi:uncharacterized ParB-like nuclease family protein
MNFRTTFILLILLLGVGAWVMFTGKPPAADQTTSANPTRLLNLSSNDVSKVVLSPSDGKRIVLERSTQPPAAASISPASSDWKITEPVAAYADTTKVNDLVDALVSSTSTAQVPIANNAADFGLDTPQFTVDLEAGPKSARIDVGRLVKAGNELYVRLEGKDVAEVISGDVLDKLNTSADKLRLAKLLNADATVANYISIQRSKDPAVMEKVAGNWQVTLPTTKPTTMPAEQTAVQEIITAIGNMQANGFGDADSNANLLIGQPQATVTISDKPPTTQPSNQTATIEFGSPDALAGKNVWIRLTTGTNPPMLATVPKETMDSMLKSSLDLRDRQVLKIDPATVTEIRIVKTRPPTTGPVALPAIMHNLVITRRPPEKVDLTLGPPRPATMPSTAPSTEPSTVPAATQVASTQPATQPAIQPAPPPAAPKTVWELTGTVPHEDADDAKVEAALANFNPLRADKYLASAPPTAGQTTYMVTITCGNSPPVDVLLIDTGDNTATSATGTFGDSFFSMPRTIIPAIDGDFAKAKPAAPPTPPTP